MWRVHGCHSTYTSSIKNTLRLKMETPPLMYGAASPPTPTIEGFSLPANLSVMHGAAQRRPRGERQWFTISFFPFFSFDRASQRVRSALQLNGTRCSASRRRSAPAITAAKAIPQGWHSQRKFSQSVLADSGADSWF